MVSALNKTKSNADACLDLSRISKLCNMQLKMFFGNSLSNVMMPPTAWPFAYSDVEIVGENVCAEF